MRLSQHEEGVMKYALVAGIRSEASPSLSGICPGCGAEMIAKCGNIKIHHWAHKQNRTCDHWWESESEWHRKWKDRFPVEWQELFHRAHDGEKHIADIKTDYGLVVEFQHSPISKEERKKRESFYGRMGWVVNGLRLKRDLPAFHRAIRSADSVPGTELRLRISKDANPLVARWLGSDVRVFFDFGEEREFGGLEPFSESVLWYLLPRKAGEPVVVAAVEQRSFVRSLSDKMRLQGLPSQGPTPKEKLKLEQLRQYNPSLKMKDLLNRRQR